MEMHCTGLITADETFLWRCHARYVHQINLRQKQVLLLRVSNLRDQDWFISKEILRHTFILILVLQTGIGYSQTKLR